MFVSSRKSCSCIRPSLSGGQPLTGPPGRGGPGNAIIFLNKSFDMGYYTTFCFGLMEGNREQYDAMLEDIDKIIGDNEASLNECVNAKWYNHEEDLEKISK